MVSIGEIPEAGTDPEQDETVRAIATGTEKGLNYYEFSEVTRPG